MIPYARPDWVPHVLSGPCCCCCQGYALTHRQRDQRYPRDSPALVLIAGYQYHSNVPLAWLAIAEGQNPNSSKYREAHATPIPC